MIALSLYQAAAEYIGILLNSIPATIELTTRGVSNFVSDHPVLVFGGLVGVVVLWALFSGRLSRRSR